MSAKDTVSFVRPEVEKYKRVWQKIRDCCTGGRAIKAARELYLPIPNPEDKSEENQKRYDQYLQRAMFYEVAKKTLSGMVGQVFQKDPVIEIPDTLDPVAKDADGSGLTLIQQARRGLRDNASVGRGGFLVDYPVMTVAASQEEIRTGKVKPSILFYPAEKIINWDTTREGSNTVLTLLVLHETKEEKAGQYLTKVKDQYREFRRENGKVTIKLFEVIEGTDTQVGETLEPKNSKGQNFTEIPFAFFGCVDNNPGIDDSDFEALCDLNIGHYVNSADYEESVFMLGQPTPVATGITESWYKNVLKEKIVLGSRSTLPLPVGATFTLLQVSPNTLAAEAMKDKERQMVALGARLVTEKTVQRTLGEARLESGQELSALGACANNIAKALTRALGFCADFVGANKEKIKVELTTDFSLGMLTVDERGQIEKEVASGLLTFEEARAMYRRAGLATEEDAIAKAARDSRVDFNTPDIVQDDTDPNANARTK